MNRTYALVWNPCLGAWTVADEHARRRGKGAGAVLAAALLLPGLALAADLPTGGNVVSGSGSINLPASNQMVIDQTSNKLAIDWQSFDIAAGNKVTFNQPGSDSIALNRVLGADGSKIMGQLDANGQVFIVNPNGVLFGAGASVNVGGLVASTLDLSVSDFEAGNYQFKGNGHNASVINQGSITATDGGSIALLGGTVSNNGVIVANQGTVALAAGNKVTLDFAGDGLLNVQVDEAVVDALVENHQLIRADGGQVLLTAHAGEALLKTVVNNTGVIEARTLGEKDGKIVLLGDFAGGTVQVAGTLDASAPNGGNGGFVDTSGAHVQIQDGARVTTLAAAGQTGSWLIDPTDFRITAGGDSQTDSGIGADTLSTNLNSTSVTLQTVAADNGTDKGDIHVDAAVTWSAGTTLTLSAHNDIRINASLTAQHADGKLALHYGQAAADGGAANYVINMTNGASANLQSGQNFFTKQGSSGGLNTYTVVNDATALQGWNGIGNWALGSHLDLSGITDWEPLLLSGKFDGLGHTLSNLTVNRPDLDKVGLFGSIDTGASVRNIGVNAKIAGQNRVGGLAGENKGSISNAHATGEVNGGRYVGGLVGYHESGSIENAYATGTVTGTAEYAGGLVGENYRGTIENAYATGRVAGNEGAGGLSGRSQARISHVYATGEVTGNKYVGGLVGYNQELITHAHSTGTVTGTADNVGGLVGENFYGRIENAYATGSVKNTGDHTGGLVGWTFHGHILNAFATGAVESTGNQAGGLAGRALSTVSHVYATGEVTGNKYVGGLVGYNQHTIDNAYATGSVTGTADNVGGLVGENYHGRIDNAYATGSVKNTGDHTGGLVGWTFHGHIKNAYATGAVESTGNQAGGLAGRALSTVSHVYATSKVTGLQYVGGLVGYNEHTIDNAYATGSVTGTAVVGGLIGHHHNGSISNSYWATDSSGITTATSSGDAAGVSGLTLRALLATPMGFDSSVWGNGNSQSTHYLLNVGGTQQVYNLNDLPETISPGSSLNRYNVVLTLDQLQAINSDLGGRHVLGRNLDASATAGWNGGAGFRPIGWGPSNSFTGTFDGLGHTISGLTISRPDTEMVGLFGISEGTLRNVGLLGGASTGKSSVGSLVGFNSYGGTVSHAYATGAVTGTDSVGGLVGFNSGTTGHAYATGAVTSTSHNAGGLVGTNDGSVSNAFALGVVTGIEKVGGLVGTNNTGGTVSHAYATGAVTGTHHVGGLLGDMGTGTVSNAYWATDSSGQSQGAGSGSITGLTGLTLSDLIGTPMGFDTSVWGNGNNHTTHYLLNVGGTQQVYNRNDLPSTSISPSNLPNLYSVVLTLDQLQAINNGLSGRYVLGRNLDASATAGWNASQGFQPIGTESAPFSGVFDGLGHTLSGLTINRAASDYVGLFGFSAGALRNVGLLGGTVTGQWGVGGLLGYNDNGIISNAFATGAVHGDETVGGLVGYNSFGAITNAYATGAVSGENDFVGGLVGYSTGGTINYVYATGAVTGNLGLGGLIGFNTATLSNSFYATTSDSGATINNGGAFSGNAFGTGKTFTELTQVSTFAGWDIADAGGSDKIWRIYQGHGTPLLRSFLTAVTVDLGAVKTYDGDTVGNLTYTPSLSDAQLLGQATYTSSSANVGTYGVAAGNLTVTPGLFSTQAGYDISYGNLQDVGLTIDRALLTVGAAAVANKVYDGTATAQVSAGGLVGLVNGETLNLTASGTFADQHAGTGKAVDVRYTLGNGTGLASNYELQADTRSYSANITPAELIITAKNAGKTYDGQAFSGGNGVSYNGFVNGETETVLGGTLIYGGSAQGAVNAGTYGLSASGLSADNYTLSYTDGSLTVDKASLTITAQNAQKTAGQSIALSGYSAEGLVAGDSLASVSLSSAGTPANAAAGSYAIVASNAVGSDLGNYAISYIDGSLEVRANTRSDPLYTGALVALDRVPRDADTQTRLQRDLPRGAAAAVLLTDNLPLHIENHGIRLPEGI